MSSDLLFIDDETTDPELATRALRKAGIRVDCRVVATETELTVAIQRRLPVLILCDIRLPEWDCWSALSVCRRIAPGVPFALYSGMVSVQDARKAMQRGVFGTVEKERPDDLVALVRRALSMQRL